MPHKPSTAKHNPGTTTLPFGLILLTFFMVMTLTPIVGWAQDVPGDKSAGDGGAAFELGEDIVDDPVEKSEATVPEGLTGTDWQGIRQAFEQNRHEALSVYERNARHPLTIDAIAQQAYLKASNSEILDDFGYSVSVSGDTVVVGAYFEDSNAMGVNGNQGDNSLIAAGAAYVFVRDSSGVWMQQAYLKASNTDARDFFGRSVTVSGDTVVVGAPREASNATGINGNQADNSVHGSGAAYVFVRDAGGVWSQQAYLKASNPDRIDNFGSSVAVSGDTVVVGAPFESSNAKGVNGDQTDNSILKSGAAYVFVRDHGGVWSQQAYLKASNTDAEDEFGISVAASGDSVVVGANLEDSSSTGVNGNQGNHNGGYTSGAAYIFIRDGGAWRQQAYLKASNTGANDEFGWSVSMSSDTVVVGAKWEDSRATGVNGDQTNNFSFNSGAAYIFVRNGGGVWSQQAFLKASNAASSDWFGWTVAVSGNTVVVGAESESSNATGVNGDQADNSAVGAGAAYVFVRDFDGVWSQHAYLKASNTDVSDHFGFTLAISGSTVVVGAPFESSNATGVNGDQSDNSVLKSGAAYVFHVLRDCNENGIDDPDDIAQGTSEDCPIDIPGLNVGNLIPDECEPDCQGNGIADSCELISFETSQAQDSCTDAEPVCPDIKYSGSAYGGSTDGDSSCTLPFISADQWYRYTPGQDGMATISHCGSSTETVLSIHDGCPGNQANEIVCNADDCASQPQVIFTVIADTTYWIRVEGNISNPESFTMQITGPPCNQTETDCNGNTVPDSCDIATGTSIDCDNNGMPDSCEIDCNGNGILDSCDIATGNRIDCDNNGIPDSCEIDCNENGILDSCDLAEGTSQDCFDNGIPDECTMFGVKNIYWTRGGGGHLATGAGTWVATFGGSGFAAGIAIDAVGEKIYWTDFGPDIIRRANLDGSNIEDLIVLERDVSRPWGIALDLDARKMYFVDQFKSKIQRSDLDGGNVEDVLTGLGRPVGIALDTANSKMYWTDFDLQSISRADLDGSHAEVLVAVGLVNPLDIELDLHAGKMYWADSALNTIRRADLNGNNVEHLVTSGLRIPAGIALDVSNGKIYWSNFDSGNIQRANLDGTNVEDLVTWTQIGTRDIELLFFDNTDCNHNLIPDSCDIDNGASFDCNSNAVPDECEQAIDSDSDGLLDECDACPDSDMTATIVIGSCNSGVSNDLFDDGCTMADLFAECVINANDNNQTFNCIAQLSNDWRASRLILTKGFFRIMGCVNQLYGDVPIGRVIPQTKRGKR